jgi:hypothetical protein
MAAPPSASLPTVTPSPPPMSSAPHDSRRFNSGRFSCGILALVAGVLAGASTGVAWWTDYQSSVYINFLPGGSLMGGGGSGTVTATYASLGLGPVGALYEAVLAMALAVTVLALLAGILGVFGSLGKLRSPKHNGRIRGLLIVVLIVALVSVVLVPIAQPYALSQSSGGCSGFGSESPCNTFWGAGATGGTGSSWGANAGYYLTVASVVLLLAGLVLWILAWRTPWGTAVGASPVGTAMPGSNPVDRLFQLKQLLDSGHLSESEFQAAKASLFAGATAPPSASVGGPPGGVEESLTRLKAMHDGGRLSDQEYTELRARVLTRV